jgi:hypothetical protein
VPDDSTDKLIEQIEWLNFAYTHFDYDEYMKVLLEKNVDKVDDDA